MHGIGHLPGRLRQRDNIPKNVPNNGKSRWASTSRIDSRIRAPLYANGRWVNFYFRRRKCFLNVVTVTLRPRLSSRHFEMTVLINYYCSITLVLFQMLFYTGCSICRRAKFTLRRIEISNIFYLHFGYIYLCFGTCMFHIYTLPNTLYKNENKYNFMLSARKAPNSEICHSFHKESRKTRSFNLRRIKLPTYFSVIARMKFSDVLKRS